MSISDKVAYIMRVRREVILQLLGPLRANGNAELNDVEEVYVSHYVQAITMRDISLDLDQLKPE